ncbi:MAG: type II toxin-antitoxin system VapC family toxin [Magnetococcales bacterium]|nr:type II toxin-antitoxin system VapC family toxin [Magnetococcales bacterium]
MILIVDASVACKWYLHEEGSNLAMALLKSGPEVIAPDLIFAEAGNVLYKHLLDGTFPPDRIPQVAAHLRRTLREVVPSLDLFSSAVELAAALRHPIYDCFYLALAQREKAPLITADQRLLNKLKNQDWGGRALSLQEWSAMDGPPKLPI